MAEGIMAAMMVQSAPPVKVGFVPVISPRPRWLPVPEEGPTFWQEVEAWRSGEKSPSSPAALAGSAA